MRKQYIKIFTPWAATEATNRKTAIFIILKLEINLGLKNPNYHVLFLLKKFKNRFQIFFKKVPQLHARLSSMIKLNF